MEVDPYMTRAMKTFFKVPRYGTACGRVMMKEATLLNWQRVERILESGFDEALGVLLETESGKYLAGAKVAADVENGLMNFLIEEYRFLDEICSGTLVSAFLHLKYDFHNMKVLFKEEITGMAHDEGILLGELGTVDTEEMRLSVSRHRRGYLPALLEESIETIRTGLDKRGNDPQMVDTIADRLFLEARLKLAVLEKSRFLVNFATSALDLANLKVLLRGVALGKERSFYEEAFATGGKIPRHTLMELSSESPERISARLLTTRYGRMLSPVLDVADKRVRLTTLDKQSDEYIMEQCARMSRVAIGPERIVRYILRRENEVVLLRIILMGKLHGLTPEAIEERIAVICGSRSY